jgi:methionine--tRNA ligase beta chain
MTITYDDFSKLELRVAAVSSITPHGELEIDLGDRRLATHLGPQALPELGPAQQILSLANLGMSASVEDLEKVGLKVASVVECKPHPNADKLLVLQIELGEEKRQICAGIRAFYTPEQMAGTQVVVVTNLEPRKLRGEVSQGMLLAATDQPTGNVVVMSPVERVASGSAVRQVGQTPLLATADAATGRMIAIAPRHPVAVGSGVK